MKKAFLLFLTLVFAVVVSACNSTETTETKTKTETKTETETKSETTASKKDKITMVWYPNESGEDLKGARDAFGDAIKAATGLEVEHQTTTDYIIAIESIANGNADLAFMGAQGFVEAHNKNNAVIPLVVNTGKSGTLDDALYHSWLNVKKGNEAQYKDGDKFSIENIAGKRFSFVSNSSTSGFKVPSAAIVSYFGGKEEYKGLEQEDLLEPGFFSEVLFGGSHQGSAVNLLSGKADIAAFCDSCVRNYVELAEGEANKAGSVYRVKADAAEPFNTVIGEEFAIISVTPVLNGPFAVNTDTVDDELRAKLVEVLTSEEIANNESIFLPKGSDKSGLFKKSGDERFLEVENDWYNPIRELSK